MARIIAGSLFARDPAQTDPYAFDLHVHDLGNGHVEALALPRFPEYEHGLSDGASADLRMAAGHIWQGGEWVPHVHPPEEAPERDVFGRKVRRGKVATDDDKPADVSADDRERSARRARTTVRRLAKAKLVTDMLTLTYRENMVDRARLQRDLDVFLKRLKRVMPEFEYIAVAERQKRGAWHAHLAVRRFSTLLMARGKLVQSFKLLRSMWQGVVGIDNGNIDVSRGKAARRSVAKLAAYLAKYIGKSFDEEHPKWANTYSQGGKVKRVPEGVKLRSESPLLADAISRIWALLGPETQRATVHQRLLPGGGYFLCLSPPGEVP